MNLNEKKTYIYGLIDPRNNNIRYVGKANKPNNRYESHIKECLNV